MKKAPAAHSPSTCVALLLTLLAGCSGTSRHQQPSGVPFPTSRIETIDSIALSYVRVAVALGERDPDSLDFAVVPPSLRMELHQAYPPLVAIDRETSRLLSVLPTLSLDHLQQLRAQSLLRQLGAIHARIMMLEGRMLDFDSEAEVLFHTEVLPDTNAAKRESTRRHIAALLPRSISLPMGAHPTLSARYAAYDRQFLIPPASLQAVMKAALGACRDQTLTYLTLPPGETVDVAFVRNQPWSAFSRYQGSAHSTISVNAGFPITIDQALELACHEGYPGHHVFNTLRDIALVQQSHLPEADVQPTFSPRSYLSESAAAFAPRLAFTLAQRIRVERDILFPLTGLPPREAERYVTISSLVRTLNSAEPRIAQQYLDGQLEFVRAAQRLQEETLMEHGEATLLYLNEYRSYMLAYTDGPRRIASLLDLPPAIDESSDLPLGQSQWQRYGDLARTP